MRFLLLLLVVALAFGGIWRMLAPARPASKRARPIPRMVKCASCDLYLPEEEAVRSGEHYYCGEQHRLDGPRADDR